jgi:Bacteriophage tail sheath protein
LPSEAQIRASADSLPGLIFEDVSPLTPSAPNRADVALFVGFVRRRAGNLPAPVRRWLDQQGWCSPPYGRPFADLLDVPVPLPNFASFEALFEGQRHTRANADGTAYMGAAVRSFFAQGGRKCYVVRVGDPWPLETARSARLAKLASLIPGYPDSFSASAADRFSWRGAGHLFGLPDVSFVCFPDLADAVAADRVRVPTPPPPAARKEEFVECSVELPDTAPDATVHNIAAPRCDAEGFGHWVRAIELLTDAISGGPTRNATLREMQLVAALPIPDGESLCDTQLLSEVPIPGGRMVSISLPSTAFLQLAYPWTRTPGSTGLPEQLESPDGVLSGVLARNALLVGAFRSAANSHLADVYDIYPVLDHQQQQHDRLIERVSLFGLTPAGPRLLGDVTMSADEAYRPASVGRLVAVITRAARLLGEEVAFVSSGEALWRDISNRVEALLHMLYDAGAFRGQSPAEAYQVRCDRSTISQNDLDNGRVIAHVQFDAAAPIDTITVALIIHAGQQDTRVETEAA